MKLELELESDRVAPGDKVVGRVLVHEGGPSRSLTLSVSFHERSSGYDVIPFSSSAVVHEGELPTGAAVDFHFLLPADALPSVNGKQGELYWQIEATADRPGLDAHARRVVVVAID